MFHGTIIENIRLGDPTASEERIIKVCKAVGVDSEIRALKDGYHCFVRDNSKTKMPISFQGKICLARAMISEFNLLLLDEPANFLDKASDDHFINILKSLKGQKTVIMISYRPSHIALADNVIALDYGQIVMQGKGEALLPKLLEGFL